MYCNYGMSTHIEWDLMLCVPLFNGAQLYLDADILWIIDLCGVRFVKIGGVVAFILWI